MGAGQVEVPAADGEGAGSRAGAAHEVVCVRGSGHCVLVVESVAVAEMVRSGETMVYRFVSSPTSSSLHQKRKRKTPR